MQRRYCFAFSLCSSSDASQISSIPPYGWITAGLQQREAVWRGLCVSFSPPETCILSLSHKYSIISFVFQTDSFIYYLATFLLFISSFMLLVGFILFFRKREKISQYNPVVFFLCLWLQSLKDVPILFFFCECYSTILRLLDKGNT